MPFLILCLIFSNFEHTRCRYNQAASPPAIAIYTMLCMHSLSGTGGQEGTAELRRGYSTFDIPCSTFCSSRKFA